MTPALLARLINLSGENEFLELKRNDDDPESLGVYISALSNSATLAGVGHGYLIWGVDDARKVVGTTVSPWDRKVGNEPLETWLARLLYPGIDVVFGETMLQGARVVWLEVPAASHTPVRFRDVEYVRIGQVTKKLCDAPEKERALRSKLMAT